MHLRELLKKPIWKLTEEEFLYIKSCTPQCEAMVDERVLNNKCYVYGMAGLSQLFGCSLSTANRIKQSGKIDQAIMQIGRTIVVDAELALRLVTIANMGMRKA